jgi:hypothetical protein
MNNVIDPRNCKNFRMQGICPNLAHNVLNYLDYCLFTVDNSPKMHLKIAYGCQQTKNDIYHQPPGGEWSGRQVLAQPERTGGSTSW